MAWAAAGGSAGVGGGYDVRPDAGGALERERHTFANLRDAFSASPMDRLLGEGSPGLDGLLDLMEATTCNSFEVRWTDLREAELLVYMIAAEFGGEDPLKPGQPRVTGQGKAGARRQRPVLPGLRAGARTAGAV